MVDDNVDYNIFNRYAELSRYGKWLCPYHIFICYNIIIICSVQSTAATTAGVGVLFFFLHKIMVLL